MREAGRQRCSGIALRSTGYEFPALHSAPGIGSGFPGTQSHRPVYYRAAAHSRRIGVREDEG